MQLEILVTAFHGSARPTENCVSAAVSAAGRSRRSQLSHCSRHGWAELFRPVPVDPGNGSRWVPESSGTFTSTEDGGFRVDFTGCGDDKWVYPMLPLTGEERANGELAAIAFSVRAEQREGSRLQQRFRRAAGFRWDEKLPAHPEPDGGVAADLRPPADLPDALRGDALRPERLSIGFNPGSRFLDYQIRDLVLYYRK